MGQVNCRKHYLSLRKSLVLYVIAFVVLAVFLSVTTFSICDGAAEGISASYPPSGEKYYLTNEQGEQLGNGAYIGTVPVPMSKEDECTIALLEKLPIVATPIYSAWDNYSSQIISISAIGFGRKVHHAFPKPAVQIGIGGVYAP